MSSWEHVFADGDGGIGTGRVSRTVFHQFMKATFTKAVCPRSLDATVAVIQSCRSYFNVSPSVLVNDINMDYIDAPSVHDGRDIEGRPVAKKKCNRTPEFHTERDLFAVLWHKFCGKLADAVNHRRAKETNSISEASLRNEGWLLL